MDNRLSLELYLYMLLSIWKFSETENLSSQLYKMHHHTLHAIHLPPYYLPTQYPTRHEPPCASTILSYHYCMPISNSAKLFIKTINQCDDRFQYRITSSSLQLFCGHYNYVTEQVQLLSIIEHLLVTYLYLYTQLCR